MQARKDTSLLETWERHGCSAAGPVLGRRPCCVRPLPWDAGRIFVWSRPRPSAISYRRVASASGSQRKKASGRRGCADAEKLPPRRSPRYTTVTAPPVSPANLDARGLRSWSGLAAGGRLIARSPRTTLVAAASHGQDPSRPSREDACGRMARWHVRVRLSMENLDAGLRQPFPLTARHALLEHDRPLLSACRGLRPLPPPALLAGPPHASFPLRETGPPPQSGLLR